jgi:phospholipid/cholesterol/gamma-HCH transport system ATP-binding protein
MREKEKMATVTNPAASSQPQGASGTVPLVTVDGVHKSYGSQRVLRGVSLTVNRGETIAVLGRSGTGKSVLLHLIVGLEQPDEGSISIDGEPIAGKSLDELGEIRKKMGFLFQGGALYDSLTVGENVAFPMRHHRREMSNSERNDRVHDLLREVGLESAIQKMPSSLSGGMKKRAGLARALALEPAILLLDEPTAGLDPIGSSEIDELVLKLQKEHHMAFIVVTHDLHSAKTIADRLILLKEGEVVIDGSYADLEKSDIPFVKEFLT